jgi:hypothetical protein
MNEFSFVWLMDIPATAKSILTSILVRILTGTDEVYITPYLERISAEQILKGWDEKFNSTNEYISDTLNELEMSNRTKFGPRSIQVPWVDRKENVMQYFNDKPVQVNAITPGNNTFRPLSIENAITYLKPNTNSGLPFLSKKKSVFSIVSKNFQYYLDKEFPAILFTRTQEALKTRNVWGYPIADTIQEMRFYRIVLEYQSRVPWRTALVGPEAVDLAVTKLMNYARDNNLTLVSIDFSLYDASCVKDLIISSFVYIKSLFQTAWHKEIDQICKRMYSIGLVTPDGVLNGNHGIPSGSTFTNECDSIIQYQISQEYYEELKDFQIQGDDGIYAVRDHDSFLDHFKKYGLSVNKDKSYTSNNFCTYLQLLYEEDYRTSDGIIHGIYPTYRALLRICYQERFTDFKKDGISGKDYYAIRTLSILENCKHHPLFHELCDYVITLDKYSLIPSDEGVSMFVKSKQRNLGKDVNFNIYRPGDDVQGIKNFESYKYILSKENP